MKSEMLETLNTYWNQEFPNTWPLAYQFKEMYPDRWVRFHSLPDSKRYAENDVEYTTILERHNTVIDDLNGAQSLSVLLVTAASDSPDFESIASNSSQFVSKSYFWKSLAMGQLNAGWDESTYWHLFVSKHIWHKGIFDPMLKLVADDSMTNVMIINMEHKWLYHPYDGGADIILVSKEERDILKSKYKMWLSNHPAGY